MNSKKNKANAPQDERNQARQAGDDAEAAEETRVGHDLQRSIMRNACFLFLTFFSESYFAHSRVLMAVSLICMIGTRWAFCMGWC